MGGPPPAGAGGGAVDAPLPTRRSPQDRALRAALLAHAPALDHPRTRRETAWRVGASVGLLLLGLVCLAVALERIDRSVGAADALRADGVRVAGVVTATDGGDHVTVSYRAGGTPRSGVVTLDDVAPPYADGDAVTVFHDRSDPARMSIDDQDNEGALSVSATAAGVVAGAGAVPVGLLSAVRWWRVRRRLARARFQPGVATVVLGRRKRITVRVTVAGQELVLRRAVLLPPAVWREVSDLANWSDGPCWVACSPGRRCVLATPGGSSLWRMTTPRAGRQARRWARQDAAALADRGGHRRPWSEPRSGRRDPGPLARAGVTCGRVSDGT